MFSRAGYALKQTFSQIWRNKSMYFISVLAITAMMLILGIFFISFVNVDMFTTTLNKDYNVIQVYLDEDNDGARDKACGREIEALDGVDSVVYETKKEALNKLRARWGENGYLLDNLQQNPLPNSYLVYVEDKDAADAVAEAVTEIEGVDDVTYYRDTIEKLARVTKFIETGSMIAMLFLIVVSVIIVANTIKLTVHNRAQEIGIMKYLGATDWFVRAPFILGGIVIGLVSSVISTGLIYAIYTKVIDLIQADIMRMLSVNLVPADYLVGNLLVMCAALGVGIGTCGSIISIRRFLAK